MDPYTDFNDAPTPADAPGPGPSPPDVADAAASVDRLAAAERASAAATLEDRLFLATRAAIGQGVPPDVAGVAVLLDDLAERDRASAPPSLEDRLQWASAAALATGPSAPIARIEPRRWAARLATAAAIALAATGAAILASRPRPAADSLAAVERTLSTVAMLFDESSDPSFSELRGAVDSLDLAVRGSAWFRTESSFDEESL
jgi:hypothetical protein